METTRKKSTKIVSIKNAGLVVTCCFIIAVYICHFVPGNPTSLMNSDPNNHPLPGNFMGTTYKDGVIMPVIQTLSLTASALNVERYFTLYSVSGRGSLVKFVSDTKDVLSAEDLRKVQEVCDKQRGSVASVVTPTLRRYEETESDSFLSKNQELFAIQRGLEEATALEPPMMEQNLPIIGTITTLGTLMGLPGMVTGMIRSFTALAVGDSADPTALSQDISKTLANTAFGTLTGALTVISYNYCISKIGKLTYSPDEVGFPIVQTFAATYR